MSEPRRLLRSAVADVVRVATQPEDDSDGHSRLSTDSDDELAGSEQNRLEMKLNEALEALGLMRQEIANLKEKNRKLAVADCSEARPQPSQARLAPLSKVNGNNPDVLRSWFDMAPIYLRASRMEPESEEAVLFLVAHFEWPLNKWFLSRVEANGGQPTGGFPTTSGLRKAALSFHAQRDPVKRARDKLKSARQVTSALDFAHQLEELYLYLPGYPEEMRVHDFVYGLKPAIKEAVLLHDPKSFAEAVRIAQMKDNLLFSSKSERGAGGTKLHNMRGTGGTRRKNSLKFEERMELIKKGACFYCKEEGHIRPHCPKLKETKASN